MSLHTIFVLALTDPSADMKRALALFLGLGDSDQMEWGSDTFFFFRNVKQTAGDSVIDSVYTSKKLASRLVLSIFLTNADTLRFCVRNVIV